MSVAQSPAPDTALTTPAPDPREAFLHWEASTRDAIDVKRAYIKIADGDHATGVLLAQIIFWNLPSNGGDIDRLRVEKEGKFWLRKKRTDWSKECEINPKQFDRASKRLINRGIITKKLFRYLGSPTLHMHLNVEALMAAVEAVESPASCNVPPGENGICPQGKMEFAQKGNSLRPKIVLQREKSKPEIPPSFPPILELETEETPTGFHLDEDKKTETPDTAPQLPAEHQTPVCAIEGKRTATDTPAPVASGVGHDAQKTPEDDTTAEAYETIFHTLPVDHQADLREDATARLVEKGYRRDYLTTMLVMQEVCHILATQTGGCVAPVPLASAVGSAPSPAIERPTRPPEKPQAPLPAPTRSHLLREDLEDISRLLVVYNHAIDRGEVGRSDAERLKFCAEAKHALRCGENPPALFADNLKHQRWHCDQTDEDTARRQLQAHLYGGGAPRSAQPVPASVPPPLSKDAWCVRELQRELVQHGVQEGEVWAYLRHEHHWTQERCQTIARELDHYQQACQQAAALRRLGEHSMQQEEWPAAPFPADVECAECGAVGGACACKEEDF